MHLCYEIYYFLITKLRSKRWFAQKLFKLKIPETITGPYWDFTTLLMKKGLKKYIKPDMTVLEIGIGKAAILLVFICKICKIQACGIDIQPAYVISSKKLIDYNAVENVKIYQSDLFTNVSGLYDLIFFNSVYIKTDWGDKFLSAYDKSVWNGGQSGIDVISRFISASEAYLKKNGTILLGVNSFYLKENDIMPIIEQSSCYIVSIIRSIFNPSRIYVIKKECSTDELSKYLKYTK